MASRKKKKPRKTAEERATWLPYYKRVTRNRKKYTRKEKHKPDYKTFD